LIYTLSYYAGETGHSVTIQDTVQAVATGGVVNTAVFTGQETFEETAGVFVFTARVFWPVIFKQ
jgi:hypothetical protein